MNLRSGTVVGAHILKPEHRPAFEEGVRQTFKRWTALSLAIEHGWGGEGGKEKGDALVDEVIEWFYHHKEHAPDDLEILLDEAISQDFNVDAEDGSPMEVAKYLCTIYRECFEGNYSSVQKMMAQAIVGAQKSRRQVFDNDGTLMGEDSGGESSSDDDGVDEDMDVGMADANAAGPSEPEPKPAPVIDDDGFELVQSKGRRGRR